MLRKPESDCKINIVQDPRHENVWNAPTSWLFHRQFWAFGDTAVSTELRTMAHALIFGASGISGWSILNQARNYPSSSTFSRITGLTNRPFSLEQAQLPEDERIQIVPGIDLTKSVDEVAHLLKQKVPNVESVSHVFFTGDRVFRTLLKSA